MKDITGEDQVTGRVWWDVAENTKTALTPEQQVPSVVIPAEWEVVCTGTMTYGFAVFQGEALFTAHAATLYKDLNHPDAWKIAPYGENSELLLVYDATDESFRYPAQVVGTHEGQEVRVADFDSDQGADHADDPSYRGYYDKDEEAYLFLSIWRKKNAEGKWAIACYGYDAFVPDAE